MIIEVHPVLLTTCLCQRRYRNHRHGCPNYGIKPGCPPREIWNHDPAYAIITEFDLGAHVERMRALYPEWSKYQLVCCLYWQGTARKVLKEEIVRFLRLYSGYVVDPTPEAAGVNVTATLKAVGIELEWPPEKIVRQVALAYQRRKED